MKEVEKIINMQAQLIDSNGEVHDIGVTEHTTEKYYSIRKLNIKVMYMDLIEAQAQMCSSSLDITLFGKLFKRLNSDNQLIINVTQWSKENNISRSKINKILKSGMNCGFLKKITSGVYFVNPYIIRGTAFGSNQKFESIQRIWDLT